MKHQYNIPCNIAGVLNLIGERWTLLILHTIQANHHTFKELQDSLLGIPTNLLSSRLKSLEESQLITCELYQSHPPRYAYYLSGRGADLQDIFNSMVLWGERHLDTCQKKLVHESCGQRVDIAYYCEGCRKMVTSDEVIAKDFLCE